MVALVTSARGKIGRRIEHGHSDVEQGDDFRTLFQR
jgi:hypothetical protein